MKTRMLLPVLLLHKENITHSKRSIADARLCSSIQDLPFLAEWSRSRYHILTDGMRQDDPSTRPQAQVAKQWSPRHHRRQLEQRIIVWFCSDNWCLRLCVLLHLAILETYRTVCLATVWIQFRVATLLRL